MPPLTGPVVDEAGLLDSGSRAALEELARSVRSQEQGRAVQLQFLVVPDLQGEPIEDFSIRVAEAWKIGTKGKDNGILFVVSRDDHRMRIEVGGGLEGELTDARSGRIIRETLVPAFRAGQFGPGLHAAALQALAAVGAVAPDRAPPMERPSRRGLSGPLMLLIILPLLLLSAFGRKRRYWYGGGPFIGGGWSGGSGGFGGGGGWGGGGGGFSGGGSSGSW